MSRPRQIIAVDCETDPFRFNRVPAPFVWGAYDGNEFRRFSSTKEFVAWLSLQNAIVYAHNGGKFDFMFLLSFIGEGIARAQIINGRIVKVKLGRAELRDSFAIIPEALKKFGTKKEIEYWKLEEEHRETYREEIDEYLYYDCLTLYNAVSAYRKIAGTQLTIASNALRFARKIGIEPGKTNSSFDEDMRDFYYGGRTECFRPGTHHNIHVLDIHSAYPYAMCQRHATGSERISISKKQFLALTISERQRCFIRLHCRADGCFPIRTATGLDFPYTETEFGVTGWEYVAADELGLISNVKFLEIWHFPHSINFTAYVEHWYGYKSSHDKLLNPIEYTIGKIMMNSLYGKLAQNPARYFDYKICPGGTFINHCQGDFIFKKKEPPKCRLCDCEYDNHGWTLAAEYEEIEIHRREALWKYVSRFGENWRSRPLYNNVATGASITGFTRAHLLRAIHTVGIRHVIYCDTDSVICDRTGKYKSLPMSPALGDWEHEGIGEIGHFAGKKLYGIKMPHRHGKSCEPGCRKTHENKIASKGSKLDFDQLTRIVNGEKITWQNDTPTFSIAGSAKFVVRSIRSTAKGRSVPQLQTETVP